MENRGKLDAILELLAPKIKKMLKETHYQEREDLEQELKEKIIKKVKEKEQDTLPDFFDFLDKE